MKKYIIPFLLFTFIYVSFGQGNDTYVNQILDHPNFNWESQSSSNVKIFYNKNSFIDNHRMMVLRSMETTIEEVLNLFEISDYNSSLNVFYVESRAEMKELIGQSYTGYANWSANTIFLVLNSDWRSFEKHEFAHIITMGTWGQPNITSQWMVEGIAVYADGWCQNYSVNEIAHYFLVKNEFPQLNVLFEDYQILGEIRAGFCAASLIDYIVSTYGVHILQNLWTEGVQNIEELLDNNLEQIEHAWKTYLKQTVDENNILNLDTIYSSGCGQYN